MKNIIYQKDNYRIIEFEDLDYNIKDLKGDCYKPENNPSIDLTKLKHDESEFELKCIEQGVYGYVLEIWRPEVDHGWAHVDSCYGFVGEHEIEKHYIIDELKRLIKVGES